MTYNVFGGTLSLTLSINHAGTYSEDRGQVRISRSLDQSQGHRSKKGVNVSLLQVA